MTETETRQTNEIIWREDLYPRFEPDPARIQQYAEVLELLPPIEINQHNELVDGYHRWTAYRKEEQETIPVIVTQTANDVELDRLMAKRNADFGIQLKPEEKKRKAKQWFINLGTDEQQIADDLAVTPRTVSRWLADKKRDLKAERDRQIAEMWLACHTEEEIAGTVDVGQSTVNDLVQKLPESDTWQKAVVFSEYQEPKWKPPIYNIWTFQHKTNHVSHFGNSEQGIVDTLLYLYTEPFDIVVDPFAGGGATIDICKKRLRRYWVSDRKPIVEREREIREWDILEGPPPILDKRRGPTALLYLDPPYWKQAEGKYSEDPQDLANMELDEFYEVLTGFIRACAERMYPGTRIAMLMQPTQWNAPNREEIDHVMDIIQLLPDLRVERRRSCPYPTQQYNPQQVNWSKENKTDLTLTRELITWRIE